MVPTDTGTEERLLPKTVEQLLEEGIDIPDDIAELEKLLDSDDPAEAGEEPKADEPKPTGEGDEPKPADEPKPGDEPKAADAEPTLPSEDEPKGPPAAVIRATREALHAREREVEEKDSTIAELTTKTSSLEQQIQDLQTKLAAGSENVQEQVDAITGKGKVNVETVTDEELAELSRVMDDEAVAVVQKLVGGLNAATAQLAEVVETNERLVQEREELRVQQVRDAIDNVPLLGVLRLAEGDEADARWERVKAYRHAVETDPDFKNASRDELLNEVGRRMEKFLGPDTVKTLIGDPDPAASPKPSKPSSQQVVDKAVKAADDAAVPTSLSDMPASGEPVSQDEIERAEAMSHDDVSNLFEAALDKGVSVDDLIGKLMTAGPR